MPGSNDNEKGYFENILIIDFNESLIDLISACWHSALLFWMDATHKVELYSRSTPSIFVYYNNLLRRPGECMKQFSINSY